MYLTPWLGYLLWGWAVGAEEGLSTRHPCDEDPS